MGLFDKLRNEFIDIIEWIDESNNTLVFRFDRYQNEIKNGAKLIVRESQVAVFIKEGNIADVFTPGTHTLSTANLPILSTLEGWKYGFDSPFKAEVYFVSTRNITDQKWGTKNAITLHDNRYGMIEIRAFGTYVIRVKDAAVFMKEIVGTDGYFTTDKIAEQLKSMIVARFTDTIGKANLPVENYASNIHGVSQLVHEAIGSEFEEYGIELTKFVIENVSMPDKVKEEIFEYSRLNAIDLDKLTKIKMAKAIEGAAENDGTAGAGMGFAVAGMMNHVFQQSSQNQSSAQTPPPVPTALTYYTVINGQQSGPFEIDTLKQMAVQNVFTKETLVWYAGMANWSKAGVLPELKHLFELLPPPIPVQ